MKYNCDRERQWALAPIALLSNMAANIPNLKNVLTQVVADELGQDTDDSYLEAANVVVRAASVGKHREQLGTTRIENYVEETVPRYSDPLFRAPAFSYE